MAGEEGRHGDARASSAIPKEGFSLHLTRRPTPGTPTKPERREVQKLKGRMEGETYLTALECDVPLVIAKLFGDPSLDVALRLVGDPDPPGRSTTPSIVSQISREKRGRGEREEEGGREGPTSSRSKRSDARRRGSVNTQRSVASSRPGPKGSPIHRTSGGLAAVDDGTHKLGVAVALRRRGRHACPAQGEGGGGLVGGWWLEVSAARPSPRQARWLAQGRASPASAAS